MRWRVVRRANERLGEVRTMRLGAVLYGLGYLLIPLAASVPVFLVFQTLLPLGTALLFPANSALVSHRADRHEYGLMLGVQQALRGVASVIGPIWAGFAYQTLGPRVPFFLLRHHRMRAAHRHPGAQRGAGHRYGLAALACILGDMIRSLVWLLAGMGLAPSPGPRPRLVVVITVDQL